MINYKKILQLYFDNVSQRTISSTTSHSRHTIRDVIQRANEKGLTETTDEMDNLWLFELLYPERQTFERGYYPVNWEYVHKELMKKNVTLQLLHREYKEKAKSSKKFPYSYTSFCRGYRSYASKYNLTMPIKRKPGELVEIDWIGSTLPVIDSETGIEEKAYLFVATFPYSQYFYVEAFMDMKVNNWLSAHIHAFKYFKGVPESIVPDNLKTGVTKADRYEPILNAAYQQLADHYQTVIVPARVKRPKDKPAAEGTAGYVSRYIIGALRNYQCFSVKDLNKQIHKLMEEMNHAPFQKRTGSRYLVFVQDEQPRLIPPPLRPFLLSEWRVAKVQRNYHVQIDKNYYSTPFEYVQDNVDIKLTNELVEIYF
ncbi:IS21 family transposase [Gracilibacillus salinarum]|uniref:IS21 family transposase n=1 Tax=Gracilibacillus salinarum TaxID=2932255 RepID=A0ABY4GMN3_9BACI|nr:IS21 family transposase [Gracilibacillus salinarum]UOQ84622.1 IS21 family transposase [Gracilibacillus salinarum]